MSLLDLISTDHHRAGCRCIGCRADGRMTAADLVKRAQRAADLELAGKQWRELRADCAADLVAAALERTAGTLPLRQDPQHSLTVYCGRAANWRASKVAEQNRDKLAAQLEADRAALSIDGLAPADRLETERETAAQLKRDAADRKLAVRARTAEAADRLAPDDENVAALLYRAQRKREGCTDAQVARELRTTAGALRTKASRGADKLAAESTAVAVLRTITRGALRTAAGTVDYLAADMSRDAGRGKCSTAGGKLTRELHSDWRVRPNVAAEVTTRKLKRTRSERERAQRIARKVRADRTARTVARDNLRSAQLAATRPTANASGSAALRRHAAKTDNRRAGSNVPANR